jgi:hypothetical protein
VSHLQSHSSSGGIDSLTTTRGGRRARLVAEAEERARLAAERHVEAQQREAEERTLLMDKREAALLEAERETEKRARQEMEKYFYQYAALLALVGIVWTVYPLHSVRYDTIPHFNIRDWRDALGTMESPLLAREAAIREGSTE